MQALIISETTRRVELRPDYPEPSAAAGEAMIRVRLAGICATDLELARGYMDFAGVLGHEVVGTVTAGPEPLLGRRVVAEINCGCGKCADCRRGLPNHCSHRTVLGISGRDGVFAELFAIPVGNCHLVPDSVSDQQAVFVEPLAAAAHVLDAAAFEPGMHVAVLGCGRLGLLVAQVLALQSCELIVVGRNPLTLELCERWGLHTARAGDVPADGPFDVVVDCTGSPDGLRLAQRICRPCGTIVLKSTYAEPAALDLAPLVINEIHLVGSRCGAFPRALRLLAEHRVHVDELVTAVYPLAQGPAALEAAAWPENIKVLLRPGSA